MNLITAPIAFLLQELISLTGNLGWSIILLTIIVRTALLPLVLPSMKKQVENRKKMKAIKPKLDELKVKLKADAMALSQAQMALYKEHGIQLFSWSIVLPFVQIVFLIALYQVLLKFINADQSSDVFFYGFDLVKKDSTYVLVALSVITQFFLSAMILPGVEQHDLIPDNAKSKKLQEANKKETDQQEMAESVMQQTMFFMPIMTGLFALNFPSGVVLYWIATTLYSIVQQYFISGWGGVEKYSNLVLRRQVVPSNVSKSKK